ncbi:unnamed protein product [Dovyalis caffra]|uniref:Uncharacterized protein n=1 Tax=Dovyalis caffra TaxID=77055 RepID=A0AAV1RRX6_9ROSI|nr:unnamed protein product [Dovyalis caffra]
MERDTKHQLRLKNSKSTRAAENSTSINESFCEETRIQFRNLTCSRKVLHLEETLLVLTR